MPSVSDEARETAVALRLLAYVSLLAAFVIFSVIFYVWFRFVFWPDFPAGEPGRTAKPIQFGESIVWQGGTVSSWDYSICNPGGFDTEIEWVGPRGTRKRLAYAGDTKPELKRLSDGTLQATFGRVTLLWRSLDSS